MFFVERDDMICALAPQRASVSLSASEEDGRAKEAGFDLAYVDDAFYFHHGCKSFTKTEQQNLIADHSLYYDEKYPQDNLEIARLRDENPLDYIRKKISEYINIKDIRARNLKVGYLLNLGKSRSGGIISILQILYGHIRHK